MRGMLSRNIKPRARSFASSAISTVNRAVPQSPRKSTRSGLHIEKALADANAQPIAAMKTDLVVVQGVVPSVNLSRHLATVPFDDTQADRFTGFKIRQTAFAKDFDV